MQQTSNQNTMLGIGSTFPEFKLNAIQHDEFTEIDNTAIKGKWSVIFSWPFDFTFVCPTEIMAFNILYPQFQSINCALLGLSIDSQYVHQQWQKNLGDKIVFPWLSDVKRDLSMALGIIDPNSGGTYRATYIIDPNGIIRSISIMDLSVGRNPDETLRLVQAFQTGKLCGCNWTPGTATLN
jgi:peroxiredoxin (alkyl hydroperoxide reductase subunit C)